MLELLVATVIGTLVIVGSVLLFLGGVRLSLGMQATSHALRTGSSGVDRLRLELEESTAMQLPDDTEPLAKWPAQNLGQVNQYLSEDPADKKHTLSTAVFVSQAGTRSLAFRTSVSQQQTLTIASRVSPTKGSLLYRGDSSGAPAPSNGRFLWQWSYSNGAVVSKTVLYRKLAPTWDAVTFRRGSTSGQVLRYRLLLVEKDSYNRERSAIGNAPDTALDASDYAINLLNYAGEAVPPTALPAQGAHP